MQGAGPGFALQFFGLLLVQGLLGFAAGLAALHAASRLLLGGAGWTSSAVLAGVASAGSLVAVVALGLGWLGLRPGPAALAVALAAWALAGAAFHPKRWVRGGIAGVAGFVAFLLGMFLFALAVGAA